LNDRTKTWYRACTALLCLAGDIRLGGMVIRARAGPVRDAFLSEINRQLGSYRRVHPTISDGQLFGDIDVSATLQAGKTIRSLGLLADRQTLVLTMAERTGKDLAARFAQHLDTKSSAAFILLDESASDDDEKVPDSLVDRLAFCVNLEGLMMSDLVSHTNESQNPYKTELKDFNTTFTEAALSGPHMIDQLSRIAMGFGIDSLRAPVFALRCARALASLRKSKTVTQRDILAAVDLVYLSRAKQWPHNEDQVDIEQHDTSTVADGLDIEDINVSNDDLLIDAVKALIPPNLLEQLTNHTRQKKGNGAGTGEKTRGRRRGRPLPSQPGRLDGRARIDFIATLRAAAPWQPLRQTKNHHSKSVVLHTDDLRLHRFEQRSDRLLIFTIDASGSSAIARLNEVKGAIELLLAKAYARRDHVALISFRGTCAEILLPPTRSLVQTKRRLAALPGGGGTPLAAGLRQAYELAIRSKTKGLTPTIIVMTDGRANIALDGRANRSQAIQDSESEASVLKFRNIEGLVIDTSPRPHVSLQKLAGIFDALYVPLPRVDAYRLQDMLSGILESS